MACTDARRADEPASRPPMAAARAQVYYEGPPRSRTAPPAHPLGRPRAATDETERRRRRRRRGAGVGARRRRQAEQPPPHHHPRQDADDHARGAYGDYTVEIIDEPNPLDDARSRSRPARRPRRARTSTSGSSSCCSSAPSSSPWRSEHLVRARHAQTGARGTRNRRRRRPRPRAGDGRGCRGLTVPSSPVARSFLEVGPAPRPAQMPELESSVLFSTSPSRTTALGGASGREHPEHLAASCCVSQVLPS